MSFLFRLGLLTDHELSTMNSPPRPPSSWKELLPRFFLVFTVVYAPLRIAQTSPIEPPGGFCRPVV